MRPDAGLSTRTIRVALAPDLPVVSAGVAALLAAAPELTVVDLPGGAGLPVVIDVVLYDPQTCRPPAIDTDQGRPTLIALSWTTRDDTVSVARTQGAAGYLSKQLTAAQLISSIRTTHAGARAPYVVEPSRFGSHAPRPDGLTARELEVVSMITQGFSNDEIARRLFLSINSVKTYIRTGYRKIGATRRPQAVLWGVAHGLAPVPHHDPASPLEA